MCTININTLDIDHQVFWQTNYLSWYGLTFHNLRRVVITALINEGVSPYRICDVVRHKIQGMSEVIMMHNLPTATEFLKVIFEDFFNMRVSKLR